jgi:hypothetical protein
MKERLTLLWQTYLSQRKKYAMMMPILANDVTNVYKSDSGGDCCFLSSVRREYATGTVPLHFCIHPRNTRTNDNTELKEMPTLAILSLGLFNGPYVTQCRMRDDQE